ncbi:hypothetical protein H6G00_26660 [Leptolyngbya sp. FACHB-541]|uniref:hypothetical protein n=1 Tax=Leptolyngbya sp. FACHB-541 TaxID=2692810 RepID=UPI001683C688|nr:hypothetical protein [Leptolyngbya sp. FACHB-541]MBD2000150.1 hypothetical protein [Leptolyngbya sp. FACHB-541]
MSNNLTQKFNQGERSAVIPGFSSSLRKKYSISIFILIILSVLNISLASDEVNSNIWSFSVELKVTSTTLFLVFLFWLPVLLPLLLTQFPQLQNSLTWLREQGIEEVETNLLKIKLRYGVQEASQSYEEKVWNPGATGANLSAQEVHQQIEKRYQDAIALVDAASNIDSVEALKRIDQLATYYDKVREEMPSGSNRTRLMRDISSTMWALVTKTTNFPVYERLISNKAGERMSAYKYLEWQPSIEYIDLLLSRAIGILEMPFGQYSALLALRRIVTTKELNSTLSKKTIDILHWSTNLDYMGADRRRLMVEILSILETNA